MELRRKSAEDTAQDETVQKAQQFGQKADQVTSKATQAAQEGANRAKKLAKEIKEDLGSDIAEGMVRVGKLGFSVYLYAILAYGIFVFESLTALLLLTAWVVAYERDRQLMKMMLNVLVLYLGLKVSWSVFYTGYSFIYNIIPYNLFGLNLSVLHKLLSSFKGILSTAFDLLMVLIGLRGISMARKGKYIKVKFVEDLIKQ